MLGPDRIFNSDLYVWCALVLMLLGLWRLFDILYWVSQHVKLEIIQ